jgi:hypothetical protein
MTTSAKHGPEGFVCPGNILCRKASLPTQKLGSKGILEAPEDTEYTNKRRDKLEFYEVIQCGEYRTEQGIPAAYDGFPLPPGTLVGIGSTVPWADGSEWIIFRVCDVRIAWMPGQPCRKVENGRWRGKPCR